jgi:NitT/TauT family transport system permease protein
VSAPRPGNESEARQAGASAPAVEGASGSAASAASRGAAPRRRWKPLAYSLAGVVAVVVVWEILALVVSSVVMASPAATLRALGHLAGTRDLWVELLTTLKRLVIGLAIGAVLGLGLGVLAGVQSRVRSFLEPLRWVGMTMPAVIIAVLALFWFGLGDGPVIFLVAVIVLPQMYVTTLAGVLAVDSRLVEMAAVYHFPRRLFLTEVYLPGIASPVTAGLTLATGVSVRAVILGEVLAASNGIGHSFTRAQIFLKTPELFAWVLVLLALMALLEFGLLRPVRRRALRWRRPAAAPPMGK